MTAAKIDKIENSTIIFELPIDGSVFIDNCINTTFILVSRQIRIHYCKDCEFYILTKSIPIIEGCNGMKFSYFPWNEISKDNDERKQVYIDSGFDFSSTPDYFDNYKKINDFDWLQPNKQSPNWELIQDDDQQRNLKLSTFLKYDK
eukprot:gene4080-5108_t